jgi:hypothetical protein
MDSTITRIQEISDPPPSTQPVQFKEFLSPWAKSHTTSPNPVAPQPFQINPPPMTYPTHSVKPIHTFQPILAKPNPYVFSRKHDPTPSLNRFHPYWYPKPARHSSPLVPTVSSPLPPFPSPLALHPRLPVHYPKEKRELLLLMMTFPWHHSNTRNYPTPHPLVLKPVWKWLPSFSQS